MKEIDALNIAMSCVIGSCMKQNDKMEIVDTLIKIREKEGAKLLQSDDEVYKMMQTPMGICPKCGGKDFGDHIVLNGVDTVFQVPTLLKRLNMDKHGYILQCNSCKSVYEIESGEILTAGEIEDCNKIWKNDGER